MGRNQTKKQSSGRCEVHLGGGHLEKRWRQALGHGAPGVRAEGWCAMKCNRGGNPVLMQVDPERGRGHHEFNGLRGRDSPQGERRVDRRGQGWGGRAGPLGNEGPPRAKGSGEF